MDDCNFSKLNSAKKLSRKYRKLLDTIYKDYYGVVLKCLETKISNHADAEDLIQDILLALIPKLPELENMDRKSRSICVFMTMRYKLLDYYREQYAEKQRQYQMEDKEDCIVNILDENSDTLDICIRRNSVLEVRELMEKLSKRDQYLLYSYGVAEMDLEEIRSDLGYDNVGSVRMFVSRARKRAQKIFKEARFYER